MNDPIAKPLVALGNTFDERKTMEHNDFRARIGGMTRLWRRLTDRIVHWRVSHAARVMSKHGHRHHRHGDES